MSVSAVDWPKGRCPYGHELEGLETFCWECGDYVDELTAPEEGPKGGKVAVKVTDSRTEREVRAAIKGLLGSLGYHVTDMEQERPTRVTEGLPDLFVMGNGAFTFAELKRPNRRNEKFGGLSDHQRDWHSTAEDNGVPCVVWYDEQDALEWHKAGE